MSCNRSNTQCEAISSLAGIPSSQSVATFSADSIQSNTPSESVRVPKPTEYKSSDHVQVHVRFPRNMTHSANRRHIGEDDCPMEVVDNAQSPLDNINQIVVNFGSRGRSNPNNITINPAEQLENTSSKSQMATRLNEAGLTPPQGDDIPEGAETVTIEDDNGSVTQQKVEGERYRVNLLNNRVLGVMPARSAGEDNNRNKVRSRDEGLDTAPRDVILAAQKAQDTLGVDFCGVDIVKGDDGNPYVTNVATSPVLNRESMMELNNTIHDLTQ